jgi:orotate phosphoribosyltransferase
MNAAPRKDNPTAVEAEVREKIHLEILKRTGAYHANDHVLLPSGQHTPEYIEKTLVTTEPSFTEGLGAVIAKHFAQWPVDVVLSTGPGALILSHCVARAHPSRPVVIYGTKGLSGGKRRVTLPVEFQRQVRAGAKVLLIEDLVSTGSTLNLLVNLVEQLGAHVVGVGCLWRRTSVELSGLPVFSLVSRDFPTYDPAVCPLCAKGVPLNEEFVRRRYARKPSSVQEPKAL